MMWIFKIIEIRVLLVAWSLLVCGYGVDALYKEICVSSSFVKLGNGTELLATVKLPWSAAKRCCELWGFQFLAETQDGTDKYALILDPVWIGLESPVQQNASNIGHARVPGKCTTLKDQKVYFRETDCRVNLRFICRGESERVTVNGTSQKFAGSKKPYHVNNASARQYQKSITPRAKSLRVSDKRQRLAIPEHYSRSMGVSTWKSGKKLVNYNMAPIALPLTPEREQKPFEPDLAASTPTDKHSTNKYFTKKTSVGMMEFVDDTMDLSTSLTTVNTQKNLAPIPHVDVQPSTPSPGIVDFNRVLPIGKRSSVTGALGHSDVRMKPRTLSHHNSNGSRWTVKVAKPPDGFPKPLVLAPSAAFSTKSHSSSASGFSLVSKTNIMSTTEKCENVTAIFEINDQVDKFTQQLAPVPHVTPKLLALGQNLLTNDKNSKLAPIPDIHAYSYDLATDQSTNSGSSTSLKGLTSSGVTSPTSTKPGQSSPFVYKTTGFELRKMEPKPTTQDYDLFPIAFPLDVNKIDKFDSSSLKPYITEFLEPGQSTTKVVRTPTAQTGITWAITKPPTTTTTRSPELLYFTKYGQASVQKTSNHRYFGHAPPTVYQNFKHGIALLSVPTMPKVGTTPFYVHKATRLIPTGFTISNYKQHALNQELTVRFTSLDRLPKTYTGTTWHQIAPSSSTVQTRRYLVGEPGFDISTPTAGVGTMGTRTRLHAYNGATMLPRINTHFGTSGVTQTKNQFRAQTRPSANVWINHRTTNSLPNKQPKLSTRGRSSIKLQALGLPGAPNGLVLKGHQRNNILEPVPQHLAPGLYRVENNLPRGAMKFAPDTFQVASVLPPNQKLIAGVNKENGVVLTASQKPTPGMSQTKIGFGTIANILTPTPYKVANDQLPPSQDLVPGANYVANGQLPVTQKIAPGTHHVSNYIFPVTQKIAPGTYQVTSDHLPASQMISPKTYEVANIEPTVSQNLAPVTVGIGSNSFSVSPEISIQTSPILPRLLTRAGTELVDHQYANQITPYNEAITSKSYKLGLPLDSMTQDLGAITTPSYPKYAPVAHYSFKQPVTVPGSTRPPLLGKFASVVTTSKWPLNLSKPAKNDHISYRAAEEQPEYPEMVPTTVLPFIFTNPFSRSMDASLSLQYVPNVTSSEEVSQPVLKSRATTRAPSSHTILNNSEVTTSPSKTSNITDKNSTAFKNLAETTDDPNLISRKSKIESQSVLLQPKKKSKPAKLARTVAETKPEDAHSDENDSKQAEGLMCQSSRFKMVSLGTFIASVQLPFRAAKRCCKFYSSNLASSHQIGTKILSSFGDGFWTSDANRHSNSGNCTALTYNLGNNSIEETPTDCKSNLGFFCHVVHQIAPKMLFSVPKEEIERGMNVKIDPEQCWNSFVNLGTSYIMSNYMLPYESALHCCQKYGIGLLDKIESSFSYDPVLKETVWIKIKYKETTGRYEWAQGLNVKRHLWKTRPNFFKTRHKCAQLVHFKWFHRLRTAACEEPLRFVCKRRPKDGCSH